jgi:uncharacterized protein (TIGR02246 family)
VNDDKHSKFDAKMTGVRLPSLVYAVLVGLLAGCAGSSPADAPEARAGIQAAVRQYVAASNRGDAGALAALYADDAVLLPPDHEAVEGREAIGAFWRQGTDEGLQVTTLRLDVAGDVGYLVGRYRLPPTAEEPADSGKYVLCLKRQDDGSWKVTADIWNSSGEAGSDEGDGTRSPGAPAKS